MGSVFIMALARVASAESRWKSLSIGGPVSTTRLVLVCGPHHESTRMLSARLMTGLPATAVVHHDLRRVADGVVRRRVRLGRADVTTTIELAHGCVSCTIREDLLPLLRALSADPRVER